MNKKVMLVTLLLLAILTLGAVSASDDVDALAVDDESGDAVESPLDEDEGIALDVGDETLSDGLEEKYNVTEEVLKDYNTLEDLKPGMKLIIPSTND